MNRCACRKPKSGRIGDAARQPGRATRCVRFAEPGERLAHPGPMTCAFSPYCTTQQHNAHRTEEREVLYRWHPWFGRRVFVHEMTFKGGVRIFRCAETAQGVARCVEVPEWMFDRATCCGMAYAESPRVGCAALDRLKVLILEASGTAAGAVLEARPHSLALEGEADATFKPPSSSSTARSVSTGHPETGVAPTAHGGARESDAPDGAHAAQVPAREARRGGGRGARR